MVQKLGQATGSSGPGSPNPQPQPPQSPQPNNKFEKDYKTCKQLAAQSTSPILPAADDAVLDTVGGLIFTAATKGGFGMFGAGALFTYAFTAGAKLSYRAEVFNSCMVAEGEFAPQALGGGL